MQLDDIRLRKPNAREIGQPDTFDWRNGFYYCAKCGGARRIDDEEVTACKCGEAAFCLTTRTKGVHQGI